jgi:beta-lactamase superfamily II metal-dependent hydrolase
LEYYGLNEVVAHIEPKDNSAYIVVMKDFAANYMDFNEVRTEILRKMPYTQDQKDNLAMEKNNLMGTLKQQGVTVLDGAVVTDAPL